MANKSSEEAISQENKTGHSLYSPLKFLQRATHTPSDGRWAPHQTSLLGFFIDPNRLLLSIVHAADLFFFFFLLPFSKQCVF
jgi:hypothetical protein